MSVTITSLLLVIVLGAVYAEAKGLPGFNQDNILCNVTAGFELQCGGDPNACSSLSAQAAVDDNCGDSGGHALWLKHVDIWARMLGLATTSKLPNTWIFMQNEGVSTGNLVRGGTEAAQNTWAKLTGRLVPGTCVGQGQNGPVCFEWWQSNGQQGQSQGLTALDAMDVELNLKWRPAPLYGGTGLQKTKQENKCASALKSGLDGLWFNYELDLTKNNTLTGVPGGRLAGLRFPLRLSESQSKGVWTDGGRGHYGVHYGVGASQKHGDPRKTPRTSDYGLSSWIRWDYEAGLTYPTAYPSTSPKFQCCEMSDGDFNLDLDCGCACYCTNPATQCLAPAQTCGNEIREGTEECDTGGLDCCDHNCRFRNSTTACRPSDGPCDVTEYCTGTSNACPADAFKPSTETCDGRFGLCDVAEKVSCTGTSATCPGDAPAFHNSNLGPLWAFGYNVISFGNWIATTSDVQGRVAVKYNFSAGAGYSIGDQLCTGSGECCDFPLHHNLLIGGDAWWTSGRLYPDQKAADATPATATACNSQEEVAFVGGVNHATGFASPIGDGEQQCGSCNGKGGPGCLDAEFEVVRTYYRALSNKFASNAATARWFQEYQGVHIVCSSNAASRYYIEFANGAAISSSTWWTLTGCNQTAEFIINIKGTDDITISGGSLGSIAERTIYNVVGARTVNVANTAVFGNILAVDASYRQVGSVVWGQVIVGDAPQTWQVNWPKCSLFWDVIAVTRTGPGFANLSPDQARRRQAAAGDECLPKSVLKVQTHGIFLPNDVVTIGGTPSEEATIAELLTIDGEPAFRFTADLTGTYSAGVTIEFVIADPGNQNRVAVTPTPTSFPCDEELASGASFASASAIVTLISVVVAALF